MILWRKTTFISNMSQTDTFVKYKIACLETVALSNCLEVLKLALRFWADLLWTDTAAGAKAERTGWQLGEEALTVCQVLL